MVTEVGSCGVHAGGLRKMLAHAATREKYGTMGGGSRVSEMHQSRLRRFSATRHLILLCDFYRCVSCREVPSFQLVLINEFYIWLVRVRVYSCCIHVCQTAKKVGNMNDRNFGIWPPTRSRSNMDDPQGLSSMRCASGARSEWSRTSTLECLTSSFFS